ASILLHYSHTSPPPLLSFFPSPLPHPAPHSFPTHALPISAPRGRRRGAAPADPVRPEEGARGRASAHRRHQQDRPRRRAAGRGRSEEHTLNSSHVSISYAVFCLKKKI